MRHLSNAQQKRAADEKVPASAHGVGALFDASVILLQTSIEIRVDPVLYVATSCFTDCSRIRCMTIGRDLIGSMANESNRLPEKPLSRIHIALFTQP